MARKPRDTCKAEGHAWPFRFPVHFGFGQPRLNQASRQPCTSLTDDSSDAMCLLWVPHQSEANHGPQLREPPQLGQTLSRVMELWAEIDPLGD
eukprot:505135-Amphidinium_carterae.1